MVSNPFSSGLSVQVSGDASGATAALSNLSNSLVSTKAKVIGLGAVMGSALVAGGIAKSVKSFADFDEAMQESMAVMGDVSDTMEDKLASKAREVATETTASSEEAAEAFYFLASAGLDASESLEAMPQVAAFAEAGQLEMATATDFATDIMKAFGKEADDLTMVTDRLTGVVTRHNQTMNGMGQAMSMVAPIASGLGVSIGETATLIGFLGDAGIKGSRAGRTLRQAFNRLNNVSGPAQETLDELGVSVIDSSGEMREMTAIIEDLNDAGANTADIMTIFGARAGPGMQVLLDQGAQSIREETQEVKNLGGITQDVAETQRQTFNKQLDIFRSRLNDIAITIGSQVMPHLNSLLAMGNKFVQQYTSVGSKSEQTSQKMSDLGKKVSKLFQELSKLSAELREAAPFFISIGKDIAKVAVPALTALVSIIGGVIGAFNKLNPKGKKLLITGLAVAIGALGGPLAAIAAAAVLASTHWDTFESVISTVASGVDRLHQALKDLWEFMTNNRVTDTLGDIKGVVAPNAGIVQGNTGLSQEAIAATQAGQSTRQIQVNVKGDTDVVRNVTAEEIRNRERRTTRNTGTQPSP